MGLRAKWTAAVVLVAVVPMAVLGVVVLDIQRRGLEGAEKELEAAVVDEAALGVARTLEQASDTGSRAAALLGNDALPVAAKERLLRDLVARAPDLAGIAFFDRDRRFVDAITARDGHEDEGALRAPPQTTRGFHRLRWETPLEAEPGGFVVAVISEAALEARLQQLSRARFAADDRVYLVDASRKVIAGRREAPPGAVFDAASGFATELVLTTEYVEGGVAMVGTIRTLPAQRWALCVTRPRAQAFAALASAQRAFLASLAIFAGLAALAGVLVALRVVGPVRSLMRLAGRYGKRELDAKSDVKTGDELEELGASLERMASDIQSGEATIAERARVEANLRRYLPAEAAEAASGTLDLGGARKRATVLFADVVAFTGFAERASPEDAVLFLNELFTMLSEIVFRHDGIVDKFIGDCVMAVFVGEREATEAALAAAEDMHAFVASNMPRWREAYAFTVELGIGVATGEVLMGNLGSDARMEYTAIGDAVNVAARLESIARPRQTLATREVTLACPDLAFTSLGEHALRGKTQPVEVFEVST